MTSATTDSPSPIDIARTFTDRVLDPMKQVFIGKDEVIDLLGVALVASENLFLLGPPGTAKSAVVQELGRRIHGRTFDYLLTRFTEPNELFGPFDIRKLREGDLVTNTQGMLPEAHFVFLDELLNANSAILNSLLMVLNERVFRRGRETISIPALMIVGASNHLPEDESLRALFDRFLLRVHCDNVPSDRLAEVLNAGWKFETNRSEPAETISVDDLRQLQRSLASVDLVPVLESYREAVRRMRNTGLAISDRRAIKLQRLIAASALLSGRMAAEVSDLWVLRYIWDTQEQQAILESLVAQLLSRQEPAEPDRSHPRSKIVERPDPEELSRDLSQLSQELGSAADQNGNVAVVRDKLSLLAGRCEWVLDAQQRRYLQARVTELWSRLTDAPAPPVSTTPPDGDSP